MSDMEALIQFQCELKERLARALGNYKKTPKDRLSKEYIEGRIEQVDQLWLEFLTGHKTLKYNHNTKELKSSPYINNETYDRAEEIYMESKCLMKSHLTKFSTEMQLSQPSTSNPKAQIKLPKINIPQFSGKYDEWATFRDLFTSLVHSNKSLGEVEKLHYLKAYLTGEAEQLVRNIPIVNSNYEFCWKLLQERYNNKRYICHQNLSKLFNQKIISVESAKLLKELLDTTNDCLNSLSNIGIDTKSWDVMLIHIIVLKLDPETRRQWEFSINNDSLEELPTFKKFCEFLTNRYRAIEFLESTSTKPNPRQNTPVNKMKSLHTTKPTCVFCSEEHKLSFCKAFGKEAVDVRRKFVLENNLCFNCLGGSHSARDCRSTGRCQVCKRTTHHSLLHPKGKVVPEAKVGRKEDESSSGSTDVSPKSTAAESNGTTSVVSCFSSRKINYSQVLLATAVVEAMSRTGKRQRIRALLDQGSQSSFITESTVQYLGLKKSVVQSHISGLGGDNNVISKATVMIEIKSCVDPNVTITVKAYVLKCITSLMPTQRLEDIQWTELDDIPLADPEYYIPNRIDLLLGAEVYGEIIQDGVKKGPCGTLVAQATSLGWIVSGVVKTTINPSSNIRAMHCHISDADDDINSLLKKFWEIESDTQVPKEKLFTDEEKLCEQYFAETTQRDEEGRYIVCLPLKTDPPQVTGSRDIAERRLKSLEHKLIKNDTLRESYQGVIDDYVKLKHMELVPPEEINDEKAVYLPHHAVIREDKETTKVRVVYDASCKGRNGLSLNDHLMVGPTLQPELRHTLMRWRLPPICMTADITKMYCQVKVQKNNVDYQRILWRAGPETQHYRLLRVTFGTASAPYLAVKALQQVAVDEGENFPLVCNRVKTDFYVDDLLTGCQSKEEGVEIYKQMNGLLAKGGFELMKWSSNDDELLEEMKNLGKDKDVKDGLKIKENEVMKIMGLTWNRSDDTFRYAVTLPELQQPVTKRRIISDISRFYDPLGWVGPSIIISKIIIQRLWLAGIDWDEVVPEEILKEWLTYREELKMLSQIHIPRWAGTKDSDKLVELHGFCDASKEAFAAVVYIRVLDSAGGIHVTLASSKTKVAPVKQISIPRLELCGAVLLCRLMVEIAKILEIKREHLHAWTDSTVVLAWLNSHPSRWTVFVANRVSEILTSLDPHNWSHVKSKQNPADCASRGLHPSALVKETMWLCGPEFLKQAEITYEKPKDISSNLEEIKSHCATVSNSVLERFSSLTRMTRVISWCRRFVNNARKPDCRVTGYLTSKELKDTLTLCIRNTQLEGFGEDIDFIKTRKDLPKRSKLRALNPYLDDNQVLRVGGRLENSSLTASQRHPILMPKLSHLTHLIISDAHQQTLHGGPQLMLNFIQTKYWILGVKPLVKRVYRKCAICVKQTAATKTPLMGQAPAARVTPARAFSCSGVDFAGPIQIRTTKGRGHKSHKGYICVFVCMATRAIHLEVVSDLTSEGFLQAFKRFVARRGRCSDMWSDNGTNFIGAAGELTKLARSEQHTMLKEVAEAVATNGCEWHFIPPHAPNFGGLWEAGVKSVKYHLKRVLGGSTLTYEEMATVLAQIEACLNSRPLSVQVDDPNHPSALTPGHFLVGEPLITAPDRNYEGGNGSSLRRWQYTQRMLQSFWRQWSQEYLTKFLQRPKWSRQQHQPTIGDVVVIKEDGLPPCRWLLGRVTAIHQGSDNIARVVTLKTKNGTLKRPVSKLCFLPVTE